MNYHPEAEHDYNHIHIEYNDACFVQHIKNTVISPIDDQRVDGVVNRFACPDKNIVDNNAHRIRDIERYKFEDDKEYLTRILQVLNISEK